MISGKGERPLRIAHRSYQQPRSSGVAVVIGKMWMGGMMSLYMVVENFKNGDAVPVYRRFRDRGRLAPAGLSYISSWVTDSLDRCYQLMETEEPALLDQWISNWGDLVDFEVNLVITSKEAAEKIGAQL
jgi:hypothetical protein